MAQKTLPTPQNVGDFINSFADNDQKKADSFQLIEIMKEIAQCEPRMWGPSIVGFGSYHYKYASGHEGDAPLVGFSPRKTAISLYVFTGLETHERYLKNLGKFKMGKACIYVKKLEDIDLNELKKLIHATIQFLSDTYKRTA